MACCRQLDWRLVCCCRVWVGVSRGERPTILALSVGRLTRSLPLSRPFGLPVCLARVPAARLCETPGKLGLAIAAASALLAGRRGEVQRAGGDSRCQGILRATPHGICQKIEPIGGVIRGRAYPKLGAEFGCP